MHSGYSFFKSIHNRWMFVLVHVSKWISYNVQRRRQTDNIMFARCYRGMKMYILTILIDSDRCKTLHSTELSGMSSLEYVLSAICLAGLSCFLGSKILFLISSLNSHFNRELVTVCSVRPTIINIDSIRLNRVLTLSRRSNNTTTEPYD